MHTYCNGLGLVAHTDTVSKYICIMFKNTLFLYCTDVYDTISPCTSRNTTEATRHHKSSPITSYHTTYTSLLPGKVGKMEHSSSNQNPLLFPTMTWSSRFTPPRRWSNNTDKTEREIERDWERETERKRKRERGMATVALRRAQGHTQTHTHTHTHEHRHKTIL